MRFPSPDEISLVVSDIDGTLLNSSSQLTKETLEAIRKLEEHHIAFALATGRVNMMISSIVEQFHHQLYSITCNGALVYDHHLNKTVFSRHLFKDQSISILSQIRKRNWDFICYSPDCMYYTLQNDLIERRIERIRNTAFSYKKVDSFEEIDEIASLIKIGVMEAEGVDDEEINQIAKNAGTELKNSGEKFSAIFPSGISKESGMIALQDYLHAAPASTIAFGDYDNDLPLFARAKYRVAMGNASDSLKSQSNFITCSNDDNGIAVFIDKLFPRNSQ